jgi:hypothetical protein
MPAASHRFRDPRAHLGDPIGEVWKWHNITFYRKLQREASKAAESAGVPRVAFAARAGHAINPAM